MKKLITRLVAVMLTLAVSISVFAACDWITTNTERDLNQKVATVQIDSRVDAQDILKKDLKARYMSYEYQYVYYYSYTESQAYEVALNNLVQNRVIIQKARLDLADAYNKALNTDDGELDDTMLYMKNNALANKTAIDPKKGDIEALKQYLTEYEYKNAYYNIRKSVNSMIDNYDETEDEDEETETITYTDRTSPKTDDHSSLTEEELKTTVPTYQERVNASATIGNEAFDEAIDNLYDLYIKVFDAYKIDIESSKERKKAYSSMLTYFKKAGFISENESYAVAENADNVLNYSYYANLLKSQMESAIVSKYQASLVSSTQAKLDDEAIWNQYVLDYEAQKAKYKADYSSYETALDAASDTSLVLYNPYENYGYVANILIGFTDEQKSILNAKKAESNITDAEIEAERALIAQDIDAFDQRTSWVINNHGTYADGTFSFEDVYIVNGSNDALNEVLASFIGNVAVKDEAGYTVKNDSGAEVTKWQFTDVTATAISFNDFAADYLTKIGIDGTIFDKDDETTVNYMTGYDGTAVELAEIDMDSIKQLTFAFSTDPGILSKTYGYLYSPYTSASQYVTEFADAAKALVEAGVGAYTTVLTDYGYHIMICTKVVKDDYDPEVAEDKAKFIADLDVEGTLAYKYKQVKDDALTDNEISKFVSKFIKETINDKDSGAVTYYEKNYSDLITDSSAS